VPIDHSFEGLRQDMNQLNGYSIAYRYPTSGNSLEFRKEAIASAKRVKDFVLNKLS
jgi:hypothetical protein